MERVSAATFDVQIWSDVVCPWCYVGKRRFEAALARFSRKDEVRVTWRSFELDPSAPRSYEGKGTYAERLARKYRMPVPQAQQRIDEMVARAAAEGLTFDFERARTGNTFDAHRLLHLAREVGVQDALKERLLRATFTEGEPIADRDVLAKLAGEVGIDVDRAVAVLSTDEYAEAVRDDEEEAHALGITGVPFFAIDGKYGVPGAQEANLILRVLERAAAERPSLTPIATEDGPVCDVERGC
jgi:predicted DsbA family dithiol-disulfide isomerase